MYSTNRNVGQNQCSIKGVNKYLDRPRLYHVRNHRVPIASKVTQSASRVDPCLGVRIVQCSYKARDALCELRIQRAVMERSITKRKAGKLPSGAVRVTTTPNDGCQEVMVF